MTIGKIIGIVSALALMVVVTAYSEAKAASQVAPVTGETANRPSTILWGVQQDAKENWNDVKADVRDVNVKMDTRESFEADQRAHSFSGTSAADANIMYSARTTASGMIGQPVTDPRGRKIGTLKDIILDSTGRAVLAVITDGGFMGVGDKLIALDYALIVHQNTEGDIMMPISKDTVKDAAAFSYDAKEASDDVQIIPNNGYSTAQLTRGKLLKPDGQALGNVENVVFRGGKAAQVIVSYGKPGIAEKAAFDFDDLTLARQANGTLDFRMNESQSAQFESYKSIKPN